MLTKFFSIAILLMGLAAWAQSNWETYKSDGPACKSPAAGFEIRSDFDGNGTPDVARLQVDSQRKKRRLAVWMNGANVPLILSEKNEKFAGNYLSLKAPGVVEPFVDSDDRTPIKIEFASLATGKCESSEVLYYWDKKSKKFKEVWTGD